MSEIELSIVILCYNKWNFTKSCLDDLQHLDTSRVEIVVVDNASSDETLNQLLERQKTMGNLIVLHNDTNVGFSGGCNRGYQVAQGSHVLFLNNDIRVKDNFNSWALDLTKHCTDTNLVGPTGGKVDPKHDFQFLYETNEPTKEINYLSGWCMVAKRSVWDRLVMKNEVGPFAAQSFFVYFEDTDLSFRASQLNISFDIVPIPVVHFGKVSSKQLNTHQLYLTSKNKFNSIWGNKRS